MNIKTDGLVIRESVTGEADRVVTVLTRDYGVIRAFAHSAQSIKSKNLAATQLLCYSQFNIYKSNKNVFSIQEATAKDLFFGLRCDIVSLSLAQYIAELANELAPREESADEFLRLILNCYWFLMEKKRAITLLKATAELRMLSLSGYMPDLLGCDKCGTYKNDPMYFCSSSGKLYCPDCLPAQRAVKISPGVLAAMRHICLSSLDKLFHFTLSPEGMETLCEITEDYVTKTTMRGYKTLDFYKSMTM